MVDAPEAVEHGTSPGTTAASVEAEQVITLLVNVRSDSAFE